MRVQHVYACMQLDRVPQVQFLEPDTSLKYVSKGEALVSPEFLAPNSIEESSLISSPTSGTSTVKGVDSEKRVGCWSLNDGVILSVMHEDGNVQDHVNLDSQENLGRVNQEKAATKVQAAFRGYLARRAFWTLKGIIRLQALTRGHLVRRQAVSTLYCVKGIVKFQALVRGHKVRCSDIGLAVCKICKGAKWSDSNGVKAEKLSKSVVVHKLVASLPTAIPLRLSYGPGEPNTAWEWFDRWTRSRFWEPLPEPNQNRDSISYKENKSCQTVATDKGQPKRGTWKMSGTSMDNGSIDSSDSDRSKRRPRKISSYPVQGHPQVAIE
ncbi:Protein IQ-DOMAIN 31 [Quillaja saponaria]|uniref:Protein IQ-DOMAIN 31 n=1 Tax=Quillaja saponaria TaxID=32244 RepID=A0AAD7P6A1_QUISA|nr:Protein IQ-DOMAIN 31 [Quillaja saponaria]